MCTISLNFRIRGDRLTPAEWASLPLGFMEDAADGHEKKEQNEEEDRRRRKWKETEERAECWEHVKLPAGRCDSSK